MARRNLTNLGFFAGGLVIGAALELMSTEQHPYIRVLYATMMTSFAIGIRAADVGVKILDELKSAGLIGAGFICAHVPAVLSSMLDENGSMQARKYH